MKRLMLLVMAVCFLGLLATGALARCLTPGIATPIGPKRYDNPPYQIMPWGKQGNFAGTFFTLCTDKPMPFDYEVNLSFLTFATTNHFGPIVGQGEKFHQHPKPTEILLVDNSTENGFFADKMGRKKQMLRLSS